MCIEYAANLIRSQIFYLLNSSAFLSKRGRLNMNGYLNKTDQLVWANWPNTVTSEGDIMLGLAKTK